MIDDNLLDELGLGSVPQDEKDKMKRHIEQILSSRIGEKAEATLNEQQMDEFDSIIQSGDRAKINQWLSDNLLNYQEVVKYELDQIKEEIKPQVDEILRNFAEAA